jgi:hypothetical protein
VTLIQPSRVDIKPRCRSSGKGTPSGREASCCRITASRSAAGGRFSRPPTWSVGPPGGCNALLCGVAS